MRFIDSIWKILTNYCLMQPRQWNEWRCILLFFSAHAEHSTIRQITRTKKRFLFFSQTFSFVFRLLSSETECDYISKTRREKRKRKKKPIEWIELKLEHHVFVLFSVHFTSFIRYFDCKTVCSSARQRITCLRFTVIIWILSGNWNDILQSNWV